VLVGFATSARAQIVPQDPIVPEDSGLFRLGPLRLTPSIAISNIGFDDNVFNDAVNPKRDNTAAIGPASTMWMRAGRSRLSAKVSAQYLYYSEFENQRSWNTNDQARWELPMTHLTPFVAGNYVNTRERPGYEIDSRSRREDQGFVVGSDIQPSTKVKFMVTASRATVAYARDETLTGVALSNALDRQTTAEGFQFHYQLSPLTTFLVTTEALQDRFVYQPARDSESLKVMTGFDLKPRALISGRALVGYRQFDPRQSSVPDFQGFVAAVDVRYVVQATELRGKFVRDLTYSFELLQPYYMLTDRGFALTQRITRTWDVVGRAAWQSLDYRNLAGVNVATDRVDKVREFGGGVGYRVGRTVRLGVDADQYQRRAGVAFQNDYDGLRVGASVTFGLQP